MKSNNKIKIFLVDDDIVYLKPLEIRFSENTGFKIESYPSGELCLEKLGWNPDLILLDYNLDLFEKNALNGLQTLDRIKTFNSDIPVVMLSAQDKIEVAINCMCHRATDYVVKSEAAFSHLQQIISDICKTRQLGRV